MISNKSERSVQKLWKIKEFKKTKKLIIDSFIKLAKEKDIFHITIKNICDEANINRGTFYSYYKDYPDFLKQIETNISRGIIDTTLQYNFDMDSFDVAHNLVEYYYQNAELLTILVSNDDYFKMIDHITNSLREETLPHWLKESNINEDEATLMFSYIIGGSTSLMFKWIETGFSLPKEKVEEIFDSMIKYGLYNYVYTK